LSSAGGLDHHDSHLSRRPRTLRVQAARHGGDEMDPQETADRAEAAAIARFLAIRAAFLPCWGVKAAEVRAAVKKARRRPLGR
jgi:hypothetical protein